VTTNHIFYIPTIFFLGFLSGSILMHLKSVQNGPTHASTAYRVKGRYLLGTLGLFLAIFVITHFFPFLGGAKALQEAIGSQVIFDQHISSTSGEVYARIEAFGEDGREAYRRFTYTADIIFPVSLLAFLLALALFVSERTVIHPAIRRALITGPILWFLFDMTENAMIYYLLSRYPVQSEFLAANLGAVTIMKFSFLLVVVVLSGILLMLRRNTITYQSVKAMQNQ